MNAETFIEAFYQEFNKQKPAGYGKIWTKQIYRILSSIGQKAGFEVNHKIIENEKGQKEGYGEINLIDFTYTPKADQPNWTPPAVVIEHENQYKTEETRKDFWKLCLYAVPLRIMIGYRKTADEAKETGDELATFYTRQGLRQLPDGETVLIMGWDQLAEHRQWHIWQKSGKQDWVKSNTNQN